MGVKHKPLLRRKEPPIEYVPKAMEPLVERAPLDPALIKELLERVDALYSEYLESRNSKYLKQAAGISFKLRAMYEEGSISLPEDKVEELSTIISENVVQHLRELYGDIF